MGLPTEWRIGPEAPSSLVVLAVSKGFVAEVQVVSETSGTPARQNRIDDALQAILDRSC
jgi:hypothetical protein